LITNKNINGIQPNTSGTTIQLTTPANSGIILIVQNQTTCFSNLLERCCPTNGYNCGLRYPSAGKIGPKFFHNFITIINFIAGAQLAAIGTAVS
jgi:hypothetical protein